MQMLQSLPTDLFQTELHHMQYIVKQSLLPNHAGIFQLN